MVSIILIYPDINSCVNSKLSALPSADGTNVAVKNNWKNCEKKIQ